MSRFLLLNFEEFGLNQDITKTIQPFNPFCICCLDRDVPMFDLDKCDHKDYLDAFYKPELKQFNQLVCCHCHTMLKKIKYFQAQIIESCSILLSGEFTNNTINRKKLNNLIIQKVIHNLHLPPDIEVLNAIDIDKENDEDICNVRNYPNIEQSFTHTMVNVAENDPNMEQNFTMGSVVQSNPNMDHEFTIENIEHDPNIEESFSHNMGNLVENDPNIESFTHSIVDIENDPNMEQRFSQTIANIENDPNMEQFTHNMAGTNLEPFTTELQEQHRLNKNIKTALEILERNNQSFVSLTSQLQFLNGEHLSFLEPSLLSKEILTDIPLVAAKSLSTDLENGLLNNSKLEIEIDGADKMFYDSLDLSPELEKNTTEIIENTQTKIVEAIESKTKCSAAKPKKKDRKVQKSISHIRRVKLSHEELDRERVMQAQSEAYLRYTFRCETCIVSFNYKENLADHVKRKHGLREGGVVCETCSQMIPTAGEVTQHNYRHYTRYDCIRCNKRYHTHDEAIQHCAKHQCLHNANTRKAVKCKPSIQMKRAKLKIKPFKA